MNIETHSAPIYAKMDGVAVCHERAVKPLRETQPERFPRLLLKGGRLLDPGAGIDAAADVALRDGRIDAIEKSIDAQENDRVFDCRGKIVTPGWIDLHTHAYWGATTWGVLPDPFCLASGVSAAVDAGSAGWANFPGFVEFIAKPAAARVYAFVHISGIGLTYPLVGEMEDLRFADVELTAQTALEYPETVVGIKVRQGAAQVGENGVEPLRLAVAAAEMAQTRVMAHIAAGVPLPDVLNLLRPGDIVTHCFQGRGDTILQPDDSLLPHVLEARKRGVLFDVGHGSGSFHYPTGRRAIERGFLPDVISSDLHSLSVHGPAFDLPTTASKFLNIGMSLTDVIRAVTCAPAKAVGLENEIGSLRVGGAADVSVFELVEEETVFVDTHGIEEIGRLRLKACAAARAGDLWTPERAEAELGRPESHTPPVTRLGNEALKRQSGIR